MPRKVEAQMPSTSNNAVCCFCGLGDDNELNYGKFYKCDGIVTHYYCLLLSSNMQQKGKDDEGILGFLPEDINKELRRGKRLVCTYCRKSGATLGCCNTKCKKVFHFPCGLKSGSLHQFFGEFRSYCKNHRLKQKIDDEVSEQLKNSENTICYICYDEVSPCDAYDTLWAPCCKKNAWFHRVCVQRLAMSAGYFFKCPLCNNKKGFQKAMLNHGIFIPRQDASWELVPNAFEELLYRHNRCDAEICLCPKGREHTSLNAKWELTLCRTCGSQGIHMACGQIKWAKRVWECSECISILKKTSTSDSESSSADRITEETQRSRDNNDNSPIDNEMSDSEISVGTESTEAATSESASSKTRNNDDEKNSEEEPPVRRITRRSVITIPRSPINTKNPATPIVEKCENFSPKIKRPRYSNAMVERNSRETIESDDEIVVISGPSKNDNSKIDRRKITFQGSNVNNSRLSNKKDHSEDTSKQEKSEEPKESVISSTSSHEVSTKSKLVATDRRSSNIEKRVVEIDLSEAESTIPVAIPVNSTVQGTIDGNFNGNLSECQFVITNVTSLAPEAFDNVQEQKLEANKNDSTRQSSVGNTFDGSNGGLTPQNPIVIDDESVNVAPSVNSEEKKRINFSSIDLREPVKILRFDSTMSDAAGIPTNTVFYGITIPGTNQVQGLIVSRPNGGHGATMKMDNHQIPLTNSGIRCVDVQNLPKPAMSTSVPLKAIVNERLPTNRTVRKSMDKSNNKIIADNDQTGSIKLKHGVLIRAVNSKPMGQSARMSSNDGGSVANSSGSSVGTKLPGGGSHVTASNGISPSANNLTSDNCDGDAGSGPAVQPAIVNTQPNAKSCRDRQAESGDTQRAARLEARRSSAHQRASDAEKNSDTDDETEHCTSSDRIDTPDRTGLIHKSINVRDLRFSMCGSNIVKMTVYETYTVNMKLNPSNSFKNTENPAPETTSSSSFPRRVHDWDISRRDSKNFSNSLDSSSDSIRGDNDALSNHFESTSRDDVSSFATLNGTGDSTVIGVKSRGRDELKENLDPIPVPANFTHNPTTAGDRCNKLRSRSGFNHSTRFSNLTTEDTESQRTICGNNETTKKIVPRESKTSQNDSKIFINGFNDGPSHVDPNDSKLMLDVSLESAKNSPKNSLPRNFNNDNDTVEDPNRINVSKRKRIINGDRDLDANQNSSTVTMAKKSKDWNSANVDHRINGAKNLKRVCCSSHDVSRLKKFHVNSTMKNRVAFTRANLLKCKVSIDLKKIRSVLAKKMDIHKNAGVNDGSKRNSPATLTKRNHSRHVKRLKPEATLFKSRSFDSLRFDPSEVTNGESKRSKSLEDLSILSRSCMGNSVENGSRNGKVRRRSFEKHDCVR